MTFDIEAMERELLEDQRKWRELQRRWEQHDIEIRLAIQHATLQYSMAIGQMWAAALRPAFVDSTHNTSATLVKNPDSK